MSDSRSMVINSLKSLFRWVIQEGPLGWDPYDALNSPWNRRLRCPYLRIVLIQANMYSPINMRPILKVKKGIDLKGTALLTQAYAKMYRSSQDELYQEQLVKGLKFISSESLRDQFEYDCWASHYYPYITIDKNRLENNLPDIVGTSQSIIALIEGYKVLQDPLFLNMATSASHFLADILYDENNQYPYFKYTVSETARRIVPNASAHALEALTSVLQVHDNNFLRGICENTAQALVESQRDDGSWIYSIYPDRNTKREQLDFHQGYMINGLLSFLPFSENKEDLTTCIKKGAQYYANVLFRRCGNSYYRYPLPYPVDIHNQAQGIITFAKMTELDCHYLNYAETIAKWTINNMQDETGYFYYQKWPGIINKTPHMRWGQAWMMLALATLLEYINGELQWSEC